MPANQQVRVIKVVAKTQGAKDLRSLSRQFGTLNKTTKDIQGNIGFLSGSFKSLIAGIGIREIARASDEFQLFNDRIKAFVGDADEANRIFYDLVDVAGRTKTSVSALGDIYNRVALSTQDLGLTSKQMLDVVETLQNTFRISGSSIAEATGATIQLTQGLSAGALRGQELRSVLEANAVLADLLAKRFNISRGQLIKFAESGKITADEVLLALRDNMDDLNKKAGLLGQTFGQSITIALDQFKVKIKEVNEAVGISSGFAKGIDYISENIDVLFKIITTFVISGTLFALIKQVQALNVALKASTLLSLATPIGIATAAIAGLTYAVLELTDAFEKPSLGKLKVELKEVNKEIDFYKDKLKKAQEPSKGFADSVSSFFKGETSADIKRITGEIEYWTNKQKELNKQIDTLNKKTKKESGLKDFTGNGNLTIETIASLNNKVRDGIITLKEYNDALFKIKLDELNTKFSEGKIELEQYNKQLDKLKESYGQLGEGGILDGVRAGTKSYLDSVGTLAEGLASVTSGAFSKMETAIFDSLKGSKDAFAEFTQAVLDDLLKLTIRLTITNQLAAALQSYLGGGGGGTNTNYAYNYTGSNTGTVASYNGNAFSGGRVVPHYNGGIVSQPSYFPMSGGRVGTIAEKSPEAIVPLERTNDGKLGINASGSGTNIIVNNYSNSQVETRESTGSDGRKQIEILVKENVKQGFARGDFDKVMKSNYGVKRVGR